MPEANGFTFAARKSGEVVIRHHGQLAGVLRGRRAVRFLADAEIGDVEIQTRMATLTGNYKHGNERQQHR